jgi:hypothetical protein
VTIKTELYQLFNSWLALANAPIDLQVATRAVPLAEIESAWTQAEDARRVVFVP